MFRTFDNLNYVGVAHECNRHTDGDGRTLAFTNSIKGACTCRHGQEGALAPLWKCCKVFCALVVTVKRPVNELFMHYFHNVVGFWGCSILGPGWGTSVHRPLIWPSLKKILRAPMN